MAAPQVMALRNESARGNRRRSSSFNQLSEMRKEADKAEERRKLEMQEELALPPGTVAWVIGKEFKLYASREALQSPGPVVPHRVGLRVAEEVRGLDGHAVLERQLRRAHATGDRHDLALFGRVEDAGDPVGLRHGGTRGERRADLLGLDASWRHTTRPQCLPRRCSWCTMERLEAETTPSAVSQRKKGTCATMSAEVPTNGMPHRLIAGHASRLPNGKTPCGTPKARDGPACLPRSRMSAGPCQTQRNEK